MSEQIKKYLKKIELKKKNIVWGEYVTLIIITTTALIMVSLVLGCAVGADRHAYQYDDSLNNPYETVRDEYYW